VAIFRRKRRNEAELGSLVTIVLALELKYRNRLSPEKHAAPEMPFPVVEESTGALGSKRGRTGIAAKAGHGKMSAESIRLIFEPRKVSGVFIGVVVKA